MAEAAYKKNKLKTGKHLDAMSKENKQHLSNNNCVRQKSKSSEKETNAEKQRIINEKNNVGVSRRVHKSKQKIASKHKQIEVNKQEEQHNYPLEKSKSECVIKQRKADSCQACKVEKNQLYEKYNTEVLKSTFIKQELQKLKAKYKKLKAEAKLFVNQEENRMSRDHNKHDAYKFTKLSLITEEDEHRVQCQISKLYEHLERYKQPSAIFNIINSIFEVVNQQTQRLQVAIQEKISENTSIEKHLRQNHNEQAKCKTIKGRLSKCMSVNVELQDQVADLKQQIKLLKAILKNQKCENEHASQKLEEVYRCYRNITQEHQILLKKHEEAKESYQKLEDLRSELENQFEKNLRELELVIEHNNYLKIENQKIRNKKKEYQTINASLELQLRQFNCQKEKLILSRNRLEDKAIQRQESQKLLESCELLRNRLNQRQTECAGLMQQIHSLNNVIVTKEEQYKATLIFNQNLVREVSNYKKQINQLMIRIQELKQINDNYKNRLLLKSRKHLLEDEQELEKLSAKQEKIKALQNIHGLIKKHRKQAQT